MWTFEHTETTEATPAELWVHYADPTTWPEWDHETERVMLDGAMEVGTEGTLKPIKGPATKFVFTEVEPEVGFSDVTRLPLARLTFDHRIEATPTGCRFTHGVTISGPLSPVFARIIGKNIAAGLPASMRNLASIARSAAVSGPGTATPEQ